MLIEVPKKVSINLITSTEIGPLFVDFRHFHGRIERQFFCRWRAAFAAIARKGERSGGAEPRNDPLQSVTMVTPK